MENNTIKPWATLKKAQELSGFSMCSLRRWAKEGRVPVRYSGNTAYIYTPALLDPNFEPSNFAKPEETNA